MNKWSTVYIIGESRTHMDNAITLMYNSFYIGFEVNIETDEIIDVGCTHTIDITEKFIKNIFVGKNLGQYSRDTEEEIKARYHGTSQKAIIVSYKDAVKKYLEVKQKYNN